MENINHVGCAEEKISEKSYLNYVNNLSSLVFVFLTQFTVHGVSFWISIMYSCDYQPFKRRAWIHTASS